MRSVIKRHRQLDKNALIIVDLIIAFTFITDTGK